MYSSYQKLYHDGELTISVAMTPSTPTSHGTSSRGTIFFVHGGWHTLEAHYQPFLNHLTAAGYTVVAPKLASYSEPAPADPTGADAELIRDAAVRLADEGTEFLAVAHSYGGVVATQALSGLGVAARRAQGKRGGIKRLVYVAGFMLAPGMTLEKSAPAESLGWCYYKDGYKCLRTLEEGFDVGDIFYPDLSKEQQRAALAKMVRHPQACSFFSPTATAFVEIPTVFVFLTMDAAFPPEAQRGMVTALKGAFGIDIVEEELDSGHFPSLSMPAELAGTILKYA